MFLLDSYQKNDHLAFVHIGRRDGDVPQRRRAELADVFRRLCVLEQAAVG
jgi:hypothetical protein